MKDFSERAGTGKEAPRVLRNPFLNPLRKKQMQNRKWSLRFLYSGPGSGQGRIRLEFPVSFRPRRKCSLSGSSVLPELGNPMCNVHAPGASSRCDFRPSGTVLSEGYRRSSTHALLGSPDSRALRAFSAALDETYRPTVTRYRVVSFTVEETISTVSKRSSYLAATS